MAQSNFDSLCDKTISAGAHTLNVARGNQLHWHRFYSGTHDVLYFDTECTHVLRLYYARLLALTPYCATTHDQHGSCKKVSNHYQFNLGDKSLLTRCCFHNDTLSFSSASFQEFFFNPNEIGMPTWNGIKPKHFWSMFKAYSTSLYFYSCFCQLKGTNLTITD